MFKKETEKNYTIIFTNGQEFALHFTVGTDDIEPGDSLYKGPGSNLYIFYRKNEVLSSVKWPEDSK